MSNDVGMAYLEDRRLAEELLKIEGSRRKLDDAAIATYFSPKGKPFAWQMGFTMRNWERISKVLGVADYEKQPTQPVVKAKAKAGTRIAQVMPGKHARPGREGNPSSLPCTPPSSL
jgi:hypothetical protein